MHEMKIKYVIKSTESSIWLSYTISFVSSVSNAHNEHNIK